MATFLAKFLSINTENPPGLNYEHCVHFLGEKMASLGCDVEYVEVPEEGLTALPEESKGYPRFLVVGTFPGTRSRPLLQDRKSTRLNSSHGS